MVLPSAVPERPSALKLLVLFFLRCFLRLACGDGGGSILGLVVLEMLGLEQTESPRPVSAGPTNMYTISTCSGAGELMTSHDSSWTADRKCVLKQEASGVKRAGKVKQEEVWRLRVEVQVGVG